jgi:hypothetical protein
VELALNNRELAVLIWVATGFVWVLSRCETRVWIWRIIVAYLHPQMLATLLALAAYAVGLVWLGEHGGLWDTSLINDTIIWFVTVALVLHLNSNQISEDRHFLRRRFGQAVAGTVLIEGLVNLFVLPLPVELFLFPFLFFLVAMSAVAEMKEETAVAAHVANAVLGIIGIGLVVFVVVKLVTGFGDADWAHVGRVLFLPVWLTVGLLPAVYALGFYAACDSTFRRIGFSVTRSAQVDKLGGGPSWLCCSGLGSVLALSASSLDSCRGASFRLGRSRTPGRSSRSSAWANARKMPSLRR